MKFFLPLGMVLYLAVFPVWSQNPYGDFLPLYVPYDVTVDDTLDWVGNENDLPRLFQIQSNRSELQAKGFMGMDADSIYIQVAIRDHKHINKRVRDAIWDGDAIQLGIDANGDGVQGRDPNTTYTGPHDASVTLALTENGPRAWAHHYGHPDGPGNFERINLKILRDEGAGMTHYRIHFPWEAFQVKGPVAPLIGIAFQVNDTDEGPDQERIYWGDGAGGALRPGLFKKLELPSGPENFAVIQPVKENIWHINDYAEYWVAYRFPAGIGPYIELNYQDSRSEQMLEPSNFPGQIMRYRMRVYMKELENREFPVRLNLDAPGYTTLNLTDTIPVHSGIIDELYLAFDNVMPHVRGEEEEFSIYTLLDICERTWYQALDDLDIDPYGPARALEHIQDVIRALDEEYYDHEDYASGVLPMMLGFTSTVDGSQQYFKLTCPRKWRYSEDMPLIINLHGAGSDYILDFFTQPYRTRPEKKKPNKANAFILEPWGRGNRGYRGAAGQDVWDALEEVRGMYFIDPKQIYLTGFSMGGYGTWALAVENPEPWAAIAIAGGGDRYIPSQYGVAANIAHLPVMIWHGDRDGAVSVENAHTMIQALKKAGNQTEIEIIEGRGHQIQEKDWKNIYKWLLKHDKKMPGKRTYLSPSMEHKGCYGITIPHIFYPGDYPGFSFDIKGNTASIKTEDTPQLIVDMKHLFPEEIEEVEVIINGISRYQGEPVVKQLPTGVAF